MTEADALDMKGDDSEMVNEILAELSQNKKQDEITYDPTPPPLPKNDIISDSLPPKPVSTRIPSQDHSLSRMNSALPYDPNMNNYNDSDDDSMMNDYSLEIKKNKKKKNRETTKLSTSSNLPEKVNVKITSKDKLLHIVNKIKKPFIIFLIAFILFNPILRKLLSSRLPYLFGLEVSYWGHQLRIFILSLFLGLIFFGINLFI